LLDELRSILSKKAFENAKQYFKTENYKSAIIALENVLIDFPSYDNREEVHFLIVKSSYLLAVNSISIKVEERLKATLDAFAQFEDNYPKSRYLEDLKNTYNKTIQSLNELKPNKNEI
jgi:outer membrane protein assembly factor BamD